MKLPLELSDCTVDLEEVAAVKYYTTNQGLSPVTREQFEAALVMNKRLLVTLRSGHILDLRQADAGVFASVFGKKCKEWVNEQILAWRKQFEDNKDVRDLSHNLDRDLDTLDND